MRKFRENRRERGVALLFALGILALLLILGIAFVSDMLLSQKTAVNNSSRAGAETLARSALNHAAIAVMAQQIQLYNRDDEMPARAALPEATQWLAEDFSAIVSLSGATGNTDQLNDVGSREGLLRPENAIPYEIPESGELAGLTHYRNNQATRQSSDTLRQPQWIYVENGLSGTDRRIVGRYAYRVLPPASPQRLNLAYYLKDDSSMTDSSLQDKHGIAYDLKPVLFSGSSVQKSATALALPLQIGAFDLFFGANKQFSLNMRNWLRQQFDDGQVPADPEVFRIKSGDVVWYAHRFPLCLPATAWTAWENKNNDETVLALLAAPPHFKRGDCLEVPSAAADVNSFNYKLKTGIDYTLPFFNLIGADEGSFSSLAVRRKQIAANFLDYCDSDSKPTSDSENWATNPPNYTGNEKTWFINELGVGLDVEVDPSTGGELQFKMTPTVMAELADVYGVKSVATYTLATTLNKLSFDVKANVTAMVRYTVGEGTATMLFTAKDIPIQLTAATNAAVLINSFNLTAPVVNGYALGSKTLTVQSFTTSNCASAIQSQFSAEKDGFQGIDSIAKISVKVEKFSIGFGGVLLAKGSDSVDYTRAAVCNNVVPEAGGKVYDLFKGFVASSALSEKVPGSNAKGGFLVGGMEVKDPRQNLNVNLDFALKNTPAADWQKSDWVFAPNLAWLDNPDGTLSVKVKTSPATAAAALGTGASGQRNNFSNPNSPGLNAETFDPESVEDPAWRGEGEAQHLSTAYIRNAPMHSPWELGAIHRGAAWQTIKLSKAAPIGTSFVEDFVRLCVATPDNAAGTVYDATHGDGAILDTVKISDRVFNFGMLDLNVMRNTPAASTTYAMWSAATPDRDRDAFSLGSSENYNGGTLFRLMMADAVMKPAAIGTDDSDKPELYSVAELDSGGTALWNGIDSFAAHETEFTSRAEMINLLTTTATANKRKIDELYGKSVHLFKTVPSLCTTIQIDVVAQTIRDLAGSVGRMRANGTVETKADCAYGTFDCDVTTPADPVYYDEITSTVKLRATYDCNPVNGKMKLRQIEYLP